MKQLKERIDRSSILETLDIDNPSKQCLGSMLLLDEAFFPITENVIDGKRKPLGSEKLV